MAIFGVQVSALLLVQIGVTVSVIVVYAMAVSWQYVQANMLSTQHIVLFVDAVTQGEKDATVAALVGASQHDVEDSNTEVYFVDRMFRRLRESGQLPTLADLEPARLWDRVVVILMAPLSAFVILRLLATEERRYQAHVIVHTAARTKQFAIQIMLAAIDVLLILVVLVFVRPDTHVQFFLPFQPPLDLQPEPELLALLTLSVLASIANMALLTGWQGSWKSFWQGRFLDLMGKAAKARDHDLFIRAMSLKTYVEAQPDVPAPGDLRFYAFTYTGIQALLVVVARLVGQI